MGMKNGHYVLGYLTIESKGENPEQFFRTCVEQGIVVWNLEKINADTCRGHVHLQHIKTIKKIAHNTKERRKISIIARQGIIPFVQKWWRRTEFIVTGVICVLLIFIMSNLVWNIKMTGVTKEIEYKTLNKLADNGLYKGAWTYSLPPTEWLQDHLLNEIPELLYIGIEKKGTSYQIDGVEKKVIVEDDPILTTELIAAKSGVIHKVYVKQGLPLVRSNDVVTKGDPLVSGIITNDEGTEELTDIKPIYVDGEVYANTWYELTVNRSIYNYKEKLKAEKQTKSYIRFGKLLVPIWGFKKIPYEEQHIEETEHDIYFLKWKLPFVYFKKEIYNKYILKETSSVEDTKAIAIEHALNQLEVKLGQGAEILDYYILHDTTDSGKVKLSIYVSVIENIAIPKYN